MPKPVEIAIPRQKSPEKSVPKPPEIIDLESQLMAFCKILNCPKVIVKHTVSLSLPLPPKRLVPVL